jgi:tape measure domain-containing protein
VAAEYTVALRNLVSGPAAQATRDAEKLRASLTRLESRPASVGRGGIDGRRIADDWQKMAAAAEKASAREASARIRAAQRAERQDASERVAGARLFQAAEDQKRNAGFRRLIAAQREEERFTQYKIRLMRREAAERERVEQQMLQAEMRRIRAAQRAEAQQSRAQQRARQQTRSNAAGVFGGFLMGGLAAGAAAGGAALAYGGSTVLDTAQQVESAKLRLTALLGDDKAAGAEIKDMLRAAAKTKFDWQDLVDATSSLAASFKDTAQRRYVLASLSDMVTVAGGGKQELGQVVLAINQVVGKGKLEAEELNQLIEPLKGVVSRKEFYLEVAKLMNVSGKDEQGVINKMMKLQRDGQIGANVAVQAVTNVGRAKAGGGVAGDAGAVAVRAGDTIEGVLSNIKTGLGSLIADANVTEWPGMVALKGALKDIATLFEVDNPAGKEFGKMLAQLSTMVVPVVKVAKAMFTMAVGLAQNQPLMELVGRGLRQIANGLLFVGGLIGGVIVGALALAGGLEKVLELTGRWAIAGYEAASNFITGIVNGIGAGLTRVYDAVGNVGATVISALKEKLGIASPSKVAMLMGVQTTEGYALGLHRGAGRIERAAGGIPRAVVDGMGGSSPRVEVGGRGAGAGGGIVLQITMPVQSAGDPAQFANESGPLLGARIITELDRYFGRLQAQGV